MSFFKGKGFLCKVYFLTAVLNRIPASGSSVAVHRLVGHRRRCFASTVHLRRACKIPELYNVI